jgi:hypothetical protein
MRRAKKPKNSSSARHYDQIIFCFHTAWAINSRQMMAVSSAAFFGSARRGTAVLLASQKRGFLRGWRPEPPTSEKWQKRLSKLILD